jgi:NADPH2:quinone reductase
MIIDETGGPEVLHYGEIDTPEPGPGELRIRVAYAGVNPADWKNREGMLAAFRPYAFPYVIGFDAAGIVDKLGEGVTGFAPGDRVFSPTNHGQGGQGSYAEYTIAAVDRVAHMPAGLDFAHAAALPVAALTAWQGLFDRGGVEAGQRVLIHGGSGGVGSFAVQFALWAGADVAATCSTPNVEYVRGLGAGRVIDYREEDIAAAVTAWAPGGLDYLMDAVGFSTLPGGVDLVRRGGVYVSIPTLCDDGDIQAGIAASQAKGVRRVFSTMSDVGCAAPLARIARLLVDGVVKAPPLTEYALQDAAEAHRQIQSGHTRGKIVLRIADIGAING